MNRRVSHNLIYLLPWIGDFCNSMLSVLFVLYGVSVGFSPAQNGWILAAYGITYMITPSFIGRLGDKFKRRTSLVIASVGQACNGLAYVFIPLMMPITGFFVIIAGQIIRAGSYAFFWPTIEALLSESTDHSEKEHERSVSNFCVSWSLGAAVGSTLGGTLSDFSYIIGFLIVLGIYIIGLLYIIFGLQDVNRPEISKEEPELSSQLIQKGAPNHHTKVITFSLLLGTLAYAINSKGYLGYFPNYAALPEGLHLSGTTIGQILLAFGVGQLLAFYIGRFLKNSFLRLNLSMMALLLLIIPIVFTQSSLLIGIIWFMGGFFVGRVYFIALELTMKYESKAKGAKAGVFESLVGLGTGITPIIMGSLGEINLLYPFLFLSLITGIILGISLLLQNRAK